MDLLFVGVVFQISFAELGQKEGKRFSALKRRIASNFPTANRGIKRRAVQNPNRSRKFMNGTVDIANTLYYIVLWKCDG